MCYTGGTSNEYSSLCHRHKNYNEIAESCRKTMKPVYLTKNDNGDLVVMDLGSITRRKKMLKLREELLAVEENNMIKEAGCSVDELSDFLSSVINEV